MTVYSMSETGLCPRVLSAIRLGNTSLPITKEDEERLEYYTSLEEVAALKLTLEGFSLEYAKETCQPCNRHGIHVEIDEALFKLVGHLDRRIILDDGRKIPVEIKCLGPSSWKRFRDSQFEDFLEYAAQEACYLRVEKSPGVYWVMNRDTGGVLRYIVNNVKDVMSTIDTTGFLNEDFKGWAEIALPVTYDNIIDKLNLVEMDVAEGHLCDPQPGDWCFFCRFKYLCEGKKSGKKEILTNPDLVEAGHLYRQSTEDKKLAEERIDRAKSVLINYSKSSGTDKYSAGGVSVSYHGLTTRTSIDAGLLKTLVSEDIMKKVTKESKPFESCIIRSIGE